MTLKSSVQVIVNYIKEDRKTYFVGISLSVVIGVFEFLGVTSLIPAIALFLGEEISSIPPVIKQYIQSIDQVTIGIAFAFLILLETALNLFRENYFVKRMAQWRTKLSIDYLRSVSYSEWNGVGKIPLGEIEVMLTRDIAISMKLRHMTANFISDCVLACIYVGIATLISFHTALLFISLAIIFGVIQKLTLKWRIKFSVAARDKYILIARKAIEYFSDTRSIVLSNKESLLRMFHSHMEDASQMQEKTDQLNVVFKSIHQPVILFLFIITTVIGLFYLKQPASTLLGLFYIFYRAAPRLINVSRGYGEILGESPVDVTPKIRYWQQFALPKNGSLEPQSTRIFFDKVSLGYNGTPNLLQDIEFHVEPFETVCITGMSGSGKSTIFDTICGFHKPEKGRVLLGEVEYDSINWPAWRNKIGLVRPEGIVVSGTWIDNIAFLNDAPDLKRVKKALEDVGLLMHVESMPESIWSNLDPRGSNLSAGQRQRLLLARALYRNPEILMLDEPTSNLDMKTESEIDQLLLELKGKMTILIISHSESFMKKVSKVYQIDRDGTFKLLGTERRLWKNQVY